MDQRDGTNVRRVSNIFNATVSKLLPFRARRSRRSRSSCSNRGFQIARRSANAVGSDSDQLHELSNNRSLQLCKGAAFSLNGSIHQKHKFLAEMRSRRLLAS